MSKRFLLVSFLSAAAATLGGCERSSAKAPTPAPSAGAAPAPAAPTAPTAPVAAASAPAPAQPWQAGTALDGAKAVTVPELLAQGAALKDQSVRVSGTVRKVCQHRGCWVEIADGDATIIVKSLDHGIAFPKDGVGHKMTIDGVLRIDAPEACDHGHGDSATFGGATAQAEGAHAGEAAHECPKPKVLVEVRRAELANG
jgi:Rieske Fe-S protein